MTAKRAEPRVIEPRQARSRATMERILVAVEELLADKPFDDITIAEISARSASAPTAIYARFSDKTALLLAVHERFRQRIASRLAAAMNDQTSAPRASLVDAAREILAIYQDNHQLLRSVLLADNSEMYARAAELGSALSAAITAQLAPHIPTHQRAAAERDLDFAVRTVLALAQQNLLFGARRPTRFDYPTDELVERVTRIFTDACAPYLADDGVAK